MSVLAIQVMIALVSISATGILGVLVAVFYRRTKNPSFAIRSNNILVDHVSRVEGVEIKYAGQQIASLTISKVLFWNRGREPIQQGDVAESIKIVPSDHVDLLDVRMLQANNESNNFCVSLSQDSKIGLVDFRYIDEEDGVVIQVVHTGTSSSDVAIAGKIIGTRRIKKRSIDVAEGRRKTRSILGRTFDFRVSKLIHIFVPPFVIGGLFGGFVGGGIIASSIETDPVQIVVAGNFVFGVLLVLVVFIFAARESATRWQNRVPDGLELYEEDFLSPPVDNRT